MSDERNKEVITLPPSLRDSKWFDFWSNLEVGQEVRIAELPETPFWVIDTVLVENRFTHTYGRRYIQLRGPRGGTRLVHIKRIRPAP